MIQSRCKFTLVAELATRIGGSGRGESPDDEDSPSNRFVLIRALTSGCKVAPDKLEKLFQRPGRVVDSPGS